MRMLLAAAILALAPLAAPTPSLAAPAGTIELAQYQERGFRDDGFRRDRGPRFRDDDFRRGGGPRRFERHRERCHVEIIRRRTPFGVRIERVRRCF